MNLNSPNKLSRLYLSIVLASSLSFLPNIGQASTWAEMQDAGDLLPSAQTPTGDVTTITGAASSTTDVDLYKIFISSPTAFSAIVTGGNGDNYDLGLALFDSNGLGVYANDDATLDNGQPALPANHALGPQSSGVYYLAIGMATWDGGNFPISGSASQNTYIFPVLDDTDIVGPTGPGGNSPLAGWYSFESPMALNESYSIALTGVSAVPEPETISMFLAGLGLLGVIAGRRKRSSIS
jgi:hypothetical protein